MTTATADAILADLYPEAAPIRTFPLDDGSKLARLMRRELRLPPLSPAARFVRIRDGRLVHIRGRARCRAPRRRAHVGASTAPEDADDGDGDAGRCPACGRPLLWSNGRLLCANRNCTARPGRRARTAVAA